MSTRTVQPITAQFITSEAFAPFGQMITANPDGKAYDATDAQLHLENGIPRFYIMRLQKRGRRFRHITRHLQCTQCLGSLAGKEWLMAVAAPSEALQPNWQAIRAFRIPGDCLIKLDIGTWHAGPYFDHECIDFYNLELSDTNIADHDTCNLLVSYGKEFEIVDHK
jgi:ureidoglycolate hydrolase